MAVLQLPFFLIAYFLSFLFNQSVDGYNDIFQYLFLLGNTVYFTIGLIYLNKILRFFKVNLWIASLILLLFTAGNSVIHYTTYDAYLSHAFSLSLMICLIYHVLLFNTDPKKKYAVIIGVLFGLIVLIRPFNLIAFICLPILFNQGKELLSFIRSVLPYVLYVIAPFFLTVSIQFILWKFQTGDFIVYSYGNETFLSGTHDPLFALLSYRRGFLVYNPLWAVALIYYLAKFPRIKFSLTFTFLAFGILVFLLSTWHAKLYGMCLGYRPLIEYQAFLLFPFLHIYRQKGKNRRLLNVILPLVAAPCIWYSITIGLQYQQNILPWAGPNKSAYWEIFGKTDGRYNYHFFFPEQLIKTDFDTVHIVPNTSAIYSDTGMTIFPDSFLKGKLKGVGFYSQVKTSKPLFVTSVFDFYHNEKLVSWKHKLVSKDIKIAHEFAPFYIDEFVRDSAVNKINLKFINIREAETFVTRNDTLILFYEPVKLEKPDSSNTLF